MTCEKSLSFFLNPHLNMWYFSSKAKKKKNKGGSGNNEIKATNELTNGLLIDWF